MLSEGSSPALWALGLAGIVSPGPPPEAARATDVRAIASIEPAPVWLTARRQRMALSSEVKSRRNG
jgi:hypothetical protein